MYFGTSNTRIAIVSIIAIILTSVAITYEPVVAQSGLTISPTSHDFGDLVINSETAAQEFSIINDSSSDITIESLWLTGSDTSQFGLGTSGFPTTLAPEESTGFITSYEPTEEGSKSAEVQIATADGTRYTVALSGRGISSANFGTIRAYPQADRREYRRGETLEMAIVLDMTDANSPADQMKAYEAQLYWNPSVLSFTGFDTPDSSWDSLSGFNERNSSGGVLEWYDINTDGVGGVSTLVTLEFEVVGESNDSTGVTLRFSQAEGLNVENLLPIIDTSSTTVRVSASSASPDISVSPSSHDYYSVDVGSESSQQFRIRNAGSGTLDVRSVYLTGSNADEFKIDSGDDGSFSLDSGESRSIGVTFAPTSGGSKNARLVLESNGSSSGQTSVNLRGEGRGSSSGGGTPRIVVNPSEEYDYGFVTVRSSEEKTFVISNRGSGTLEVSGVDLGGWTAWQYAIVSGGGSFEIEPGESRDLVVAYRPTYSAGHSADLNIRTNDPEDSTTTIELNGESGNGPDITADPSEVNFGDVALGSVVSQFVQIRNDGGGVLEISSFGLKNNSDLQFSYDVDGLPFLAPGRSATVEVIFSPNREGYETAILEIASNDPDEVTLDVPLSGTGVEQTSSASGGASGNTANAITNEGQANLYSSADYTSDSGEDSAAGELQLRNAQEQAALDSAPDSTVSENAVSQPTLTPTIFIPIISGQ